MAKNQERLDHLTDTGLEILARRGARGLTHRAVDRATGSPSGTTSNYFRSRASLLGALADRIFVRLQPPAPVGPPEPGLGEAFKTYAEYVYDIVSRITAEPTLWLALVELRLESTRNPDLAQSLQKTLVAGYAQDLDFRRQAKLPGGDISVALLHFALDGLLLDLLTPSIGADIDPDAAVEELVRRLTSDAHPIRMQ